MIAKIINPCVICGSGLIGMDGRCVACGHAPGKNCDTCNHALDERGRCAKCAAVLPEDLEALKWVLITWTICTEHGAHEAAGRAYRVEWTTPDPKDKRKKQMHHEWRHRCVACTGAHGWKLKDEAVTFRERIMIPVEVYQPLIDERLARWKDRK